MMKSGHHWRRHGITVALVLSLFAIYLSTLCPTVYLGDSGEFTAAAFCLGIPHNSGYPLYALLGKLFCFIPLGHIGFRVNLMSAVFGVLAVWLVYGFVLRITSSRLSAVVGSLLLGFTPVFWFQTAVAEVYTLHTFFVVLLIRLLWWWDEERTLRRLAVFVFVVGISFGNHMQTVMLAPAALFIVLSGHFRILIAPRNILGLFLLFVLALSLYFYLPIRTEAGAAIHWGDPNTLGRFLAHVTAKAHRAGYVFTQSPSSYMVRAEDAVWFLCGQFGIVLLLSVWGWLKLSSLRWRVFFGAIILFDFVYTIFLNIISLEITPFGLPSCIALAILIGVGINQALETVRRHRAISNMTHRSIRVALCLVPAIPLTLNYQLIDQSFNYTAYEHVLNIFRTVDEGGTIILDGDNNIFPVAYGRIAEGMREDVSLFDRHNLFFKMPLSIRDGNHSSPDGKMHGPAVAKEIIAKAQNGVYAALFNPHAIPIPDHYAMRPLGILYKIVPHDAPQDIGRTVWPYYVAESVCDPFTKDFMNRQVAAYFHFSLAKYLFSVGQTNLALKSISLASTVGYDDTTIHSDIGVFLTDRGLFDEARRELEKALIYYEDLSGVYNNWGYYYQHLGDYDQAVLSYGRALDLSPNNPGYYNNLGLALYHAGRKGEAVEAFNRSLSISENQPRLEAFLKSQNMMQRRPRSPSSLKTTPHDQDICREI